MVCSTVKQIVWANNKIKIKHILSVIHNTICGAVCFQFTHFSCDWENIFTLSYYHHQIGSMNYYCLGLGHETMMSAVCLSIFLTNKCQSFLLRRIHSWRISLTKGHWTVMWKVFSFMSWHQFELRHRLISATMIFFYKLLINGHQLDYVPHNHLSKYNDKAV